jgi:hypothetical protein
MTWAGLFGYSRWRQLSARAANRAAAAESSGCDVEVMAADPDAVERTEVADAPEGGAVAVGDTAFAACTVEPSTLVRTANWQARSAGPIQSGVRRLAFLFLPAAPELKIIHLFLG